MELSNLSCSGVWVEIYRRAVRAYSNTWEPWCVCLDGAITAVQIEIDL